MFSISNVELILANETCPGERTGDGVDPDNGSRQNTTQYIQNEVCVTSPVQERHVSFWWKSEGFRLFGFVLFATVCWFYVASHETTWFWTFRNISDLFVLSVKTKNKTNLSFWSQKTPSSVETQKRFSRLWRRQLFLTSNNSLDHFFEAHQLGVRLNFDVDVKTPAVDVKKNMRTSPTWKSLWSYQVYVLSKLWLMSSQGVFT